MSHLLVSSPNVHNSHGWARSNPAAWQPDPKFPTRATGTQAPACLTPYALIGKLELETKPGL